MTNKNSILYLLKRERTLVCAEWQPGFLDRLTYGIMFNLGDINHEWSQTPLKQIKKTLTFGFLGGRLGGVDDLHFYPDKVGT